MTRSTLTTFSRLDVFQFLNVAFQRYQSHTSSHISSTPTPSIVLWSSRASLVSNVRSMPFLCADIPSRATLTFQMRKTLASQFSVVAVLAAASSRRDDPCRPSGVADLQSAFNDRSTVLHYSYPREISNDLFGENQNLLLFHNQPIVSLCVRCAPLRIELPPTCSSLLAAAHILS